ncbi:hypothetical protein AB5I41_31705 [Sphingomonas sp. MMS24-JH45]
MRVRITHTTGNVRRNALYWSCLSIAAPMLSERIEGDALEHGVGPPHPEGSLQLGAGHHAPERRHNQGLRQHVLRQDARA